MTSLRNRQEWGPHRICLLAIVVGFCAGAQAGGFAGGTGEWDDPYQIATAEQLISLGADPNLLDKHFVLVADIDLKPGLAGSKAFEGAVIAASPVPVSRWSWQASPFTGSFDGSNHTIVNLTIRTQGAPRDVGLFESISSTGRITNLVLEHVNVQCASGWSVGGLAGRNQGTIANCRVSGSVSGQDRVGGLAGYNGGTIRGCSADCRVAGQLSIGGLVGEHSAGLIEYCMAQGTATGSAWGAHLGGLVGSSNGTVANCHAAGFVAGGSAVGGLLGYSGGPVLCCYASGPVIGISDLTATGGLVGRTWKANLIEACYFLPSQGDLSWDNGLGTPLTDEQMRERASFAGWDFRGQLTDGLAEVWMMPAEGGYPVLSLLSGYAPPRPPGSGTAGDPYQIGRLEDLPALIWAPDLHYRLTADIDLAGLSFTTAVVPMFTGRLNGAGHRIMNLHVRSRQGESAGQTEAPAVVENRGFFGRIEAEGVVENLCLENASLAGRPNVSSLGILAGTNAGLVRNCRVTGSVAGRDYVGGLAGRNLGVLWACSADVSVDGGLYVGGLAGKNDGGVMACAYTHGSVQGTNYVGGLFGAGMNGLIFHCYSTSAVTVVSSQGPTPSPAPMAGALAGSQSGVLPVDSYYLLQPESGVPDNGFGTPLSPVQLQDPANLKGWDFLGGVSDGTRDLWLLEPGTYPVHSWQTDSTPRGLTARLRGRSLDDSLERIITAGHTLGEIRYDFDGVIPVDHVICVQTGRGSAVDVLVSLGAYPWSDNSGDGSPANPYQISTAGQLDSLSVCPLLWDRCFILTGDIDLSGRNYAGSVLAPDVSETANEFQGKTFTGHFEGRGHALAGLTVVSSSDYVGLFGCIGPQGMVSGLTVADVLIVGSVGSAYRGPARRSGTGSLAGENTGTVEDCRGSGTVLGTIEVGGLVGHDRGSLTRCSSYATVAGTRQVGGLVGNIEGRLFACYADSYSFACGDVGGLAGYNTGDISQCHAAGWVQATSSSGAAGGLVGNNLGSISRCYSTGPVHGSYMTGGLVGRNTGVVSLGFWDAQTSGVAVSAGGFGRTTAELHRADTFVGWGGGIWVISAGAGYPQLTWTGSAGLPIENVTRRTYGGSGDPNDPFILSTPQDLVCLTALAQDWTGCFELAGDIDMAGVTLAVPISTFKGVLDGKGYSIRNLTLSWPAGSVALIDCLDGGTIQNLQVVNVGIHGDGARISALASEARNAVISCCRVTGGVTVGDGVQYVAGLVGNASATTITRCGVEIDIAVGNRCRYVGGLAGYAYGGEVRDCYARGAIVGMEACSYLAGLVGRGGGFDKCYAAVAVTAGPDSGPLGGITGSDRSDPNLCYSWNYIRPSYMWNKELAHQARGACGQTTAAMYDLHTYLDRKWDFENVWMICEGKDYPRLRWEQRSCDD